MKHSSIRTLMVPLIAAFLFLPVKLYATSGACSWHGGVNCSAGSDWDGSVICSDGWTGSSVLYSSMTSCSTFYYVPKCVVPTAFGCTSTADVTAMSRSLARIGGLVTGSTALKQCADQVSAYEAAYTEYENCLYGESSSGTSSSAYSTKSGDDICRQQFGDITYEPPDKPGYCRCIEGYVWNEDGTACTPKAICHNGTVDSNNKCTCAPGLMMQGNTCVSAGDYCSKEHGINSTGVIDHNGSVTCSCKYGFEWDEIGIMCVPKSTETALPSVQTTKIETTISNSANTNNELAARMSGRILLQVEDLGKAWYVREDGKRYYMKDGTAAYGMMRSFGLGIMDADLSKIPTVDNADDMKEKVSACSYNELGNRLKGKILLQVQQHGEAWYIHPDKCRRIYLKDGAAAYTIMRYLSLGISNSDINKIATGTIE